MVENGATQPVFSYESAVRESVRVPSAVSSETGGGLDMIYVDIIRPAATAHGLTVPTIIIPSPYYHANGRGRQGNVIDVRLDGSFVSLPVVGGVNTIVRATR